MFHSVSEVPVPVPEQVESWIAWQRVQSFPEPLRAAVVQAADARRAFHASFPERNAALRHQADRDLTAANKILAATSPNLVRSLATGGAR